jgi:hypothetical protein
VLPFETMSGGPEQEYFADGMVEDIITGRSRSKFVFVVMTEVHDQPVDDRRPALHGGRRAFGLLGIGIEYRPERHRGLRRPGLDGTVDRRRIKAFGRRFDRGDDHGFDRGFAFEMRDGPMQRIDERPVDPRPCALQTDHLFEVADPRHGGVRACAART